MKTKMEDIDKLIKETLTQEEAKFYEDLDEQNLFQMLGDLFKGKLKWIMILMNISMLVIFGLFIYCAIQFFETEVTNEMIRWSVLGAFCMMAIGMLKMFAWMQMDKNGIIREIKRLELQVSILSTKLSN